MSHFRKSVLVWLICLTAVKCQQGSSNTVALACDKATNCIECMEAHPLCNWCIAKPANTSKGFSASDKRCNTYSNLIYKGCPASSIKNITTEVIQETVNPVRDASDDGSQPAIQLSPQRVHLKLRPNEKKTIPLTFRLAKDYPVDLYYLMDLSQSMDDDKKKVANLGLSLAEEMRKITKDVRLGFGSFVDKVLMPYVNTLEDRLRSPCTNCESPYSFKHRLSLTLNTSEFGDRVNTTKISGNLDEPEGGFDALMQAIVCKNVIGWRENSRKMLIFSTDASFHSAGDGKLGGVIEPNDGECHMENNEYMYASRQDYPSISQLASKIADNRMNIIFAVTAGQTARYGALSEIIPGSVTGELAGDSSNIVQLVRDNYAKISSTVTMTMRSGEEKDDNFITKIRSACNGTHTDADFADIASCDGLNPGGTVKFEVEVQAKCANRKGNFREQFEIYPLGLSESLTVIAEVDCQCSCGDTERDSSVCSGVGTYECGICTCGPTRYGDTCQCDISSVSKDTTDLNAPCTPPPNSTLVQLPCTGRGECLCGKCERCDCIPGSTDSNCRRFTGKYCQCNPDNCPRNPKGVCSSQGACECNEETAIHYCSCYEGFEGDECECPTSNAACYDSNGVMCSNRGECKCGACICDRTTDERYFGQYCEECSTCTSKCQSYKACVKCRTYEELQWFDESYNQQRCFEDCHNSSLTKYTIVSELPSDLDLKTCSEYSEADDCKLVYAYKHEPRVGYHVYIKNEKECPYKPNYLAIIPAVVGGIVFLGVVALLIWKLVTTIHDRREFAKFEKERQHAQWNQTENPIYVQATSTFKNPMYKGTKS